jgi:hypothetical protein
MYHLRLNDETAWQKMQKTLPRTLNRQCVQFFSIHLTTEYGILKEKKDDFKKGNS